MEKPKTKSLQHLFGGSLSGLLSCIILQPLDLTKTVFYNNAASTTGIAPTQELVGYTHPTTKIVSQRYHYV
jgi:hypothetical protein